MALDGMMMHLLACELNDVLAGSKTDKINQPEKDMIIISFRAQSGNKRLLISASAQSARICVVNGQIENPVVPPMFCMLLRKLLTGSRLIKIEALNCERVMILTFDCFNEFGDKVIRSLAVEIMGKHSNIVLFDDNNVIIDAVKRVDFTTSSVRQILPGLRYELPPAQNKLDPTVVSIDELQTAILLNADMPLDKSILQSVRGFSPVICREISYSVLHGGDKTVSDLTDDEKIKLKVVLSRSLTEPPVPCLALDPKTKRPIEFAFIQLHQYENAAVTRDLESFSELIETAFSERAKLDMQKRRQDDVLKILTNVSGRVSRKLSAQKAELESCKDKDRYKKYGDLISANIWKLEKGMASCTLDDYYDGGQASIPLDVMLTPAQNAQRYYKKYRKADTAEKMLAKQIADCENELLYIDSVFDELTRADTVAQINEVRAELVSQGYVRPQKGAKQQKNQPSQPMKFVSSDGITILCGRNNIQNDTLTLKTAQNGYIWLHSKDIPGSHTVIMQNADAVPDSTLLEAAILAATFCKASESDKVPVDYTLIKHVKKPSGAKPGMVIYTNQKTLFVTPDKELAQRLLQ